MLYRPRTIVAASLAGLWLLLSPIPLLAEPIDDFADGNANFNQGRYTLGLIHPTAISVWRFRFSTTNFRNIQGKFNGRLEGLLYDGSTLKWSLGAGGHYTLGAPREDAGDGFGLEAYSTLAWKFQRRLRASISVKWLGDLLEQEVLGHAVGSHGFVGGGYGLQCDLALGRRWLTTLRLTHMMGKPVFAWGRSFANLMSARLLLYAQFGSLYAGVGLAAVNKEYVFYGWQTPLLPLLDVFYAGDFL